MKLARQFQRVIVATMLLGFGIAMISTAAYFFFSPVEADEWAEETFLYRDPQASLKNIVVPGAVAFSPDGNTLVSGGTNFRIWNLQEMSMEFSMEDQFDFQLPAVTDLSVSTDGTEAALGYKPTVFNAADPISGTTVFVDIEDGETGRQARAFPFAYSPTGRVAGVTDNGWIFVWEKEDWDAGKTTEFIFGANEEGHTVGFDDLDDYNDITALTFSPGGELLASGGKDGKVYLFDVETEEVIHIFEDHEFGEDRGQIRDVEFTPDGSLLASSGGEGVIIREVESGEIVHRIPNSGVDDIIITNDGQTLIAQGIYLNIWRIDGEPMYSLRDFPLLDSAALSPDNRTLAISGWRFLSEESDSVEAYLVLKDMSPYLDLPEVPTAVESVGETPTVAGLIQNYPNPFNAETVIMFDFPYLGIVPLNIYNSSGALVRTMLVEGRGSYLWDGRDDNGIKVGSGVYICNLSPPGRSVSTKMTMVK